MKAAAQPRVCLPAVGIGRGSEKRTTCSTTLQDVEGRAEELFGPGWRDRAEFLSHES